jgi:DNA-binding SARP family transcriptional activator
MLRLCTLGRLSLERDGVPVGGIASRRRFLALLALVAGHGVRGISRDKLLAYLWPESDTERARNSLKQALFSIRRALGPAVLVSSGDTVRLDPAAIQVDVWEFEAELERGRAAEAVTLYAGAFLDGFFVSGLGELEEWTEAERRRLARRRTDALERLAGQAAANQKPMASVHWWRQIAAAEPLSSGAALGLMRALVAAGDRAEALAHGLRYETVLQGELGLPLDDEVREFIERVRRAPETPPAFTRSTSVGPALRRSPPARALAFPAATLRDPLAELRSAPRRRPAAPLLPLALTLVLGVGINVALHDAPADPPAAAPSARLTVLPFEILGTGEGGALGSGLDALLAAGLDGLQGYRLVPAASGSGWAGGVPSTQSAASAMARRAGARLYVSGRLIVEPERLRGSAVIRDRANGDLEIAHAVAEVGRGQLFTLADELARGLVHGLYGGPGEQMVRAAATTTRSLPALKAYVEGERALRDDDYPAAVGAFRRALRADPAFALAYYRYSVAADRGGQDDVAAWSAGMAARYSDRLSEHDRRLVTAYLAGRRGRLDEAERLYRGFVADYPEDAEAWLQLGDLLRQGNPLRGRSGREAREAYERALHLDPGQGDALVYLARIAAIDGRTEQVDSLLRRAEAAMPRRGALDVRAVRAFALNDRPGRALATRALLAEPSLVPVRLALDVAVHLGELAGPARFAEVLTTAPGACDVRALGQRMLAQVAIARGQIRLARHHLEQAYPCDPGAALELGALMAAQPFLTPAASDLAELRRRLRPSANPGLAPSVRLYYSALAAIRTGDTLAAAHAARALLLIRDTVPTSDLARSLGHSLRARIAVAAGRPAAALAELESAGWERTARLSVVEASDRFLRANLLRRLGRSEEAIGWYRSIAERASYELVYLAPAELRLARIYDARDDRTSAREHYRRFVELWRDADPELQPAVEEAERRLAVADGAIAAK